MGADYKQLTEFQKKLEKLNDQQKEQFLESCCKELAARLLRKVVKRTDGFKHPTGELRRGWTTNNKNLTVKKVGDKYHIDIINPVEYASYVEYGHRTRNHKGWVDGHHMLTVSEAEIRNSSDKILQAKLNKFLKEVFEA